MLENSSVRSSAIARDGSAKGRDAAAGRKAWAEGALAQEADSRRRDLPPNEGRALEAAWRYANAVRTQHSADLLAAAEFLARIEGDTASACNRAQLWATIGLEIRARSAAMHCPGLRQLSRVASVSRESSRSNGELRLGERNEVVVALERGDAAAALESFRRNARGWRIQFERGLLADYLELAGPVARAAFVERSRELASWYARAVGNPAPAAWFEELGRIPQADSAAVAQGLAHWLAGARSQHALDGAAARREFDGALRELAGRLPSLLPTIAVARANTALHLGDDDELGRLAGAVFRQVEEDRQPWPAARAVWLQAVALQAAGRWEESWSMARDARDRLARLSEVEGASFVALLEALALDALGETEPARVLLFEASRDLAGRGERRYQGTALRLLARLESGSGNADLAVELMREALAQDEIEGHPLIVADARGMLALQLARASREAEATAQLRRAFASLPAIENPDGRRRVEALLAEEASEVLANTAPAEAERHATSFLATFEQFGEGYRRQAALVRRAALRLELGRAIEAEADLVDAIHEVRSLSSRTAARDRATSQLGDARQALEQLVAVTLQRDPTGNEALHWVRLLREEQLAAGLGLVNAPPSGHDAPLPQGACQSVFFSLERELLSWSRCGTDPWRLNRTAVRREELQTAARAVRDAAQDGDADLLATAAERLSTFLAEPLAETLATATWWGVVPDARFEGVPLAWLRLGGQFTFERGLRVVHGLSGFGASSVQGPNRREVRQVVAVALSGVSSRGALPPLRLEEVDRLADSYPTRHLRGPAARWSRLERMQGSVDVLHIAGHLSGDPRRPLRSILQFAPEPARPNGEVTASEIAGGGFHGTRLVVLGSCSTGNEAPTGLAGSLDLAKAFAVGGAESVVGTLWAIPDADLATMLTLFYRELADGKDAGAALELSGDVDSRNPGFCPRRRRYN